MNLVEVAEEIQHRVIHIFGRDPQGRRATNGGNDKLNSDPHFRDYVWFYEVRALPSSPLQHFMRRMMPSSSMPTLARAWEPLIRLDGELSQSIFVVRLS